MYFRCVRVFEGRESYLKYKYNVKTISDVPIYIHLFCKIIPSEEDNIW